MKYRLVSLVLAGAMVFPGLASSVSAASTYQTQSVPTTSVTEEAAPAATESQPVETVTPVTSPASLVTTQAPQPEQNKSALQRIADIFFGQQSTTGKILGNLLFLLLIILIIIVIRQVLKNAKRK